MYANDQTRDYVSVLPRPNVARGYATHEIENMPSELPERNLYDDDRILKEAIHRHGADWADEKLSACGAVTGSARMRDLARLANENTPVLKTHNRIGQRIDFVEYHPAYHELMEAAWKSEVHSLAWTTNEKRPQVARAALSYMWNQTENGIMCPSTMSYAIVPLLRSDPATGNPWLDKILARDYDPRPLPGNEKTAITTAMSMTEKQGGSDLRANTSRAVPTGADREYLLTGHKYFCSAPMGDIVLLTAQTEAGVTLFVAPRTLPDGTRNSIRVQRLKDKVGNRSNASSEIEFDNAIAYRIGEDGHGIRAFIKNMTHYIRMDFAIAAAGMMRQAVNLAIHHTSQRKAFGRTIRDLPMMRNTLADLAIEAEAAMLLGLRVAKSVDDAQMSEAEQHLNRILVPIGKYWNCRRVSSVALEALECHGGMGYVEEQPIARLYREAPLNSIWEGTSAVMGLDVMRAMKINGALDALMNEIDEAKGADRHFDAFAEAVKADVVNCAEMFEPHARRLMSRIAVAVQGSLLIRQSTTEVADAFCASRLGGEWAHEYGTLKFDDAGLKAIVDRAALC